MKTDRGHIPATASTALSAAAETPSTMSRREALGTSARLAIGAALGLGACKGEPVPRGDVATVGANDPVADGNLPEGDSAMGAAPGTPARFSAEQRSMLEDLVDFLIPETTTPGAKRAGVAAYIESVVLAVYDEDARAAFGLGLGALDEAARQRHGHGFARCAPPARVELVSALFAGAAGAAERGGARPAQIQPGPTQPGRAQPERAELVAFRRSVRELTIQGFCRSKLGATRVLQYEPIPGAYDGCRSLESVGRAWATS
jgi:hypothetical protein